MSEKRTPRMALLACVGLASLGLVVGVSTAAAKAKSVNKAVRLCQSVDLPLGDNQGATQVPVRQIAFRVPRTPKGSKPFGGKVTGATVGVRITHTFDRDIAIYLISPGGRIVLVDTGRGGSGDDFGTGATDCTGSLATFSDTAGTPVSAGAPPFAGSFRPDAPFSLLNGGMASGAWTVMITDTSASDNGTIHAVSLSLNYRYKRA
jgi:subtilisin-like proprotein convertase family protein